VSEILTYSQVNRADPTRTTALRNAFARDMNRRFDELISVIRKSIAVNDCFGLKPINVFQMTEVPKNAFNFSHSQDKLVAFQEWLQQQVNRGILQIGTFTQIGTAVENAWTNIYLLDSYKRGIMRARQEMIKAGMTVPTIEMSGGIGVSLMNPMHINSMGLLFTRAYNELKGVTDAMDAAISRILAQGIADGDGPRLLARKIVATINGEKLGELGLTDKLGRYISPKRRAEMIARTEIIRSFADATLNEYRNWGVLGLSTKAEWVSAADSRVCPRCLEMEGKVFTLDEAAGMIPLHPMCRCIWIPFIEN
jgi:SPP1 gp7 family putative phage head morphogenesis protein